MASTDPTREQVATLTQMDIEPPPTRGACNQLLYYINHGNGRREARIAIVREAQVTYMGKEVMRTDGKTIGKVLYLQYRKTGARVQMRASKSSCSVHPLDVFVEWGDGTRSTASITSIRLVE